MGYEEIKIVFKCINERRVKTYERTVDTSGD